MTIQFYSWPMSSGTRIQWCLEELGVPYEYVKLDRSEGGHRAADYLKVNPNGKVPALVDDGVTWFESAAITIHLGEKYGVAKGLWPKDGQARADAISWTVWALVELHGYGMQYVYHGVDSPVAYAKEDRSAAAAAYTLSHYQQMLDMLEQRLDGRDYLLDTFSLVDCIVVSCVAFHQRVGSPHTRPRLDAWLKRCLDRPARARVE